MKKIIILLCGVLVFLAVLAGCRSKELSSGQSQGQPETSLEKETLSKERTEELYALSVELTEYLNSGDTDSAMAMMDEAMAAAMEGKLEATWAQLTDAAGEFTETGSYIGLPSDGYEILEMTLVFEKASLIQRAVFDSSNRISGLFYRNGEVEAPAAESTLPDNITETSVTVDAEDGYPLKGMLTLPKEGAPVGAVVLVHGSGPSDMDGTVGGNKIFRDLAYSLAEKGVAVLRYDKRTYTYGAEMTQKGDSITIDDEVARDAIAAVKLLRAREEIEGSKVYLLGHSMGGGLLAYINSLGAEAAGYIIMAGTPRNLWELSAEQNLLAADELESGGDEDSAAEIRHFVDTETIKGNNLDSLNPGETLFGIPVEYLQDLDRIDAIALHMADKLPALILRGEKDRQVYAKDYTLWQEGLSKHPDANFISYPGLNHLFGEYTGEEVPFSQMVSVEYGQSTPVSGDVINDIASWIVERS